MVNKNDLVKSSYSEKEVCILLQDVRGKVPVLDTKEREKLNQSGVHYSEMLPVEYAPSEEYLKLYKEALISQGKETAQAVVNLASKILKQKALGDIVLVSLARAGTPVGVLLKRYFDKYVNTKYNFKIPHYTISIIRGKGIDKAAMNFILDKHPAKNIVFVDGWVGKGAINRVLAEAVAELGGDGLSPELAVLSDPASETELYGTRNDFLIPSACLNSTVSGLISRTVHLPSMSDEELHGAVYYEENEEFDLSNEFLDEIESYFSSLSFDEEPVLNNELETFKGIDEVREIAEHFGVDDINKVKPGLGETIRVLLRRVPEVVLIRKGVDPKFVAPIIQLAKEKGVLVKEYPLKKYNACGVIKDVSDL